MGDGGLADEAFARSLLNYDPDPKNWLKDVFFCQKVRTSKQFCFITFCCIVLLHARVCRSERTLLEARSQKHMKALFMFLQEMCSLGKGKMEGNYETAIIDTTSTQQKLAHGQRWIWHPRSRADRIEAHNLFPNYHYMFVILYTTFFSNNFKTELLCDCVAGFMF